MKATEQTFNKLHPDFDFSKIIKSDECRLVHCWLDYGQPTKRCRHHALANSRYLMLYFNLVFPMDLPQEYIDAALLTHGKYNCKVSKVYSNWLQVGIGENSPLFDVDAVEGINFSMGSEIQDMIVAYEKGEIMSHETTVREREEKIKQRQRNKKKLDRVIEEIKKIHDSCKYLVHKSRGMEDVVPGINDAVKQTMPGIGEVLRLVAKTRRHYT